MWIERKPPRSPARRAVYERTRAGHGHASRVLSGLFCSREILFILIPDGEHHSVSQSVARGAAAGLRLRLVPNDGRDELVQPFALGVRPVFGTHDAGPRLDVVGRVNVSKT